MTTVRLIQPNEAASWNAYITAHKHASAYHFFAFKQAVELTYGHSSAYLAAFDDGAGGNIKGVLPLFIISGPIFGKTLVSIPFCDYGGILYDDEETGTLLLDHAISLLTKLSCNCLELRQTYPLPSFSALSSGKVETITAKVRMKLELPETSAKLFSSFPDKLRSQIRKPQKEGCTVRSGGEELLDDFYEVFVYNMRDLGSPVHSKKMMATTLRFFGEHARLFVVYKNSAPIACSLVIGEQKNLVNPWASFNKNFRAIAPNMLLYWSMLEYAVEKGYRFFDFGRSTMDEGTFKFKKQWGALPEQLSWYYIYRNKKPPINVKNSGRKKELFIKIWQKLPLEATKALGPILRKRIPL
jgi:serine/alanine adding enzyme